MNSWRRCGNASIAGGPTVPGRGLPPLRSGLDSNSPFGDQAGLEGWRVGEGISGYQKISDVPFSALAKETVRQVCGWGGAIAGSEIGFAVGAACGIGPGPGALLFGLGGSIIFGTAGYFGASWAVGR